MTPSPESPVPADAAASSTPEPAQRRGRVIAAEGTLYYPKSGEGIVTKILHTRVRLNQKRVNFALGTDRRKAERLDRELRARLIAGHTLTAVKSYVAEQLGLEIPPPSVAAVAVADVAGRPFSTIGDVVKVRKSYVFTAAEGSTRRYTFCLLNLIERALQYRDDPRSVPENRTGRSVTVADYQHVLDLPLSVLTEELVDEFQQSRLLQAKREKRDAMSARISANTELRQARAVFTRRARIAYRRAKLHLPVLDPFLEAPILEKAKRSVTAPHQDVITGLFEELPKLHGSDPSLFVALLLALHAGLRRGEILHSQSGWLQTTQSPSLVLRFGNGFTTKNGEERTVPIPRWLYDLLQAQPGGYFIGATGKDRRATVKRAVAWLRGHGFAAVNKPLHGLRALYAGYLLTRFTFLVVRKRLGHKDIRTTLDHYADNPFAEEIARLWEANPVPPASGMAA